MIYIHISIYRAAVDFQNRRSIIQFDEFRQAKHFL